MVCSPGAMISARCSALSYELELTYPPYRRDVHRCSRAVDVRLLARRSRDS